MKKSLIALACLIALPTPAAERCHATIQASFAVQASVNDLARGELERIMSGIADEQFNLDCLDRISLFGGIRAYADIDKLAARIKQAACGKINQGIDRLRSGIQAKIIDPLNSLDAEEYGVGIDASASLQASGAGRDLNGDRLAEAPDAASRGVDAEFRQTLERLFR